MTKSGVMLNPRMNPDITNMHGSHNNEPSTTFQLIHMPKILVILSYISSGLALACQHESHAAKIE